MIRSAEEFIRLRISEEPEKYRRAALEEAPVEVWQEVIKKYPDMRKWVAHNKTIPDEIIAVLANDDSPSVRFVVAQKHRTSSYLLAVLARDSDDSVRMAVARHPRVPEWMLEILKNDDWEEVRRVAESKLERR